MPALFIGAKGRKDRPRLDAMLEGVARKEFDLVAAWSVDRLGRSLTTWLACCRSSTRLAWTCTCISRGSTPPRPPAGPMFGMLGIFAEYERAMIQERIRAGLAQAKAKGTKSANPIGRPTVSPEIEQAISAFGAKGVGMVKIAKTLGCGVSVVQRVASIGS